MKDYQALRMAGKQPYLLVGPWTHTGFSNDGMIIRESLAWLDAHVKGRREKGTVHFCLSAYVLYNTR